MPKINLSQKNISLDLQHTGYTNTIYAQQDDINSRQLTISLFDDGKEYLIPNDATVSLCGTRADKTVIYRDVNNFNNNLVIIDFENAELAAKGTAKYKIEIKTRTKEGQTQILTSSAFKIKVYENIYDENGKLASPQYSDLQRELDKVHEVTQKAIDATTDLQNKLDSHHFVLSEDKDVAGGVPSLDNNTKVPISELYEATTSSKGIVQLTDSVASTSTTTAATPNSVKKVNDALEEEVTRAKTAEGDLDSKKAPLSSPTLTGTPKAPTASAGTNTTQIATTAFVQNAVANLVDSAPETMNTLDELSQALGDDPNFATTVANQIGTKANSSDLTAHTGNKTNPHSVTKSQVGLGNVENKSSATIRSELTKANVTDALGYTPPTTNTTYGAAGSDLGLIKSGGDLTIKDGVAEVNYNSHSHAISSIDELQSALDGKSPTGHTHDDRYYTETEMSNLLSKKSDYTPFASFDAGDGNTHVYKIINIECKSKYCSDCLSFILMSRNSPRFKRFDVEYKMSETPGVVITDSLQIHCYTGDSNSVRGYLITDSDNTQHIEIYATVGGWDCCYLYGDKKLNMSTSVTTFPMVKDAVYPTTYVKTVPATSFIYSDAINADTLDGYHGSKESAANTYVLRDNYNYVYLKYINSDTSNNENPPISQIIVTNGSDNFYRKASLAHLKSSLGSMPASDVYSWAKESIKPSYSWSEITGKPSTFAPSSHTHNYLPLSGGTVKGLSSFTAGLKVSGRLYNGGDDEGIVIEKASNGYAGLILGNPGGLRSTFYLNSNNEALWRYNNGTNSYDIYHPGKSGTIALTSDIPTKVSQFTNDSGYITGITKSMVTTALGYTPPTTDTNTHYTTKLKVGSSATAKTNTAASNGNVYLNVLDDSTIRDSHKIVGSGSTTVTSDANGVITIHSSGTSSSSIYETGTWTPTVGYQGSNCYTLSSGTYIKVGDIVYCFCQTSYSSKTGTESIYINTSSLPFTLGNGKFISGTAYDGFSSPKVMYYASPIQSITSNGSFAVGGSNPTIYITFCYRI